MQKTTFAATERGKRRKNRIDMCIWPRESMQGAHNDGLLSLSILQNRGTIGARTHKEPGQAEKAESMELLQKAI